MEASEDRGLELGAHHETVGIIFFKIIYLTSLFPPLPPPLPPPGSPASEHPNPYAAQAERIDGEGNEPADAPLPEPPASVMPTLCP